MAKPSKKALEHLGQLLEVEPTFLRVCLDESIIEIEESGGEIHLQNGTILRLRRVQRLCITFDVDVHAALLLSHLD